MFPIKDFGKFGRNMFTSPNSCNINIQITALKMVKYSFPTCYMKIIQTTALHQKIIPKRPLYCFWNMDEIHCKDEIQKYIELSFLINVSGSKRSKKQLDDVLMLFNRTYTRLSSESIRHTMVSLLSYPCQISSFFLHLPWNTAEKRSV